MDKAHAGVSPRLGRRARHYHQRRNQETANGDPATRGHGPRILNVTPDSFAHALQHLDPGSRALLDLSLRRGLDDAEIAELLGADSEYVTHSREAAIAQLADDLGMHGDPDAVRDALLQMPEDAWRRSPEMTHANGSGNGNGAAPSVIDNPVLVADEDVK